MLLNEALKILTANKGAGRISKKRDPSFAITYSEMCNEDWVYIEVVSTNLSAESTELEIEENIIYTPDSPGYRENRIINFKKELM